MTEEYIDFLESNKYKFRLNLSDLYRDLTNERFTAFDREYRKLAYDFLQDCTEMLPMEQVYKDCIDSYNKVNRPLRQPLNSTKEIFEYLANENQVEFTYDYTERIDGKVIPMCCYLLDTDITLNYFDYFHRVYFDRFFYFRLVARDIIDVPAFLDYHLIFHFNSDFRIFSQFLKAIIIQYNGHYTYYLNKDISDQLEFWINQKPKNQDGGKESESKNISLSDYSGIKSPDIFTQTRYKEDVIRYLLPFIKPECGEDFVKLVNGSSISSPILFLGKGTTLVSIFVAFGWEGIINIPELSNWLSKNFKIINSGNEKPLTIGTIDKYKGNYSYSGLKNKALKILIEKVRQERANQNETRIK